jgi:hypothetical protein
MLRHAGTRSEERSRRSLRRARSGHCVEMDSRVDSHVGEMW